MKLGITEVQEVLCPSACKSFSNSLPVPFWVGLPVTHLSLKSYLECNLIPSLSFIAVTVKGLLRLLNRGS